MSAPLLFLPIPLSCLRLGRATLHPLTHPPTHPPPTRPRPAVFTAFGADRAEVMLDRNTQRSRGFGFVIFADREGMEAAIRDKHETEFEGRKISVKAAIPQDQIPLGERGRRGGGGGGGGRGGYGDRGGPRGGYDRGGYGDRGGGYDRGGYGDRGGGYDRGYDRGGYGGGGGGGYGGGYDRGGYGGGGYG